MDEAEFLREIEHLFDLEPGTLELSQLIEETPGWSSLTFLGLIALIDECYQTTLRPRQLNQCPTFGDLFAFVSSKGHSSLVS